jgi:hypothetical protein
VADARDRAPRVAQDRPRRRHAPRLGDPPASGGLARAAIGALARCQVLTVEHQALTARLETLLQHVDLLVEEDPDVHWTVITEVELAAQDLAWQLKQIRKEAP